MIGLEEGVRVSRQPSLNLGRLFGKGNQPQEPVRGQERGLNLQGVITDQKVIQGVYALRGMDVYPIATDSFLDKSRDEYNTAWLTRELVQNFVDHNLQAPGTLNGVRFIRENLQGGRMRYRIEGNWPFNDPTGVLSPHSEKPEDMNTAGGNGIGLKQTAIRFLRDFGVQRFEIQGEGWTVNYRMANAADVNRDLAATPGTTPLYRVQHDWLIADTHQTQTHGSNAYIVETDNPEVIRALDQFPTLGVSSENPYLKGIDYQNQYGAIKWLPTREDDEPEEGRLFINGQVMNYKRKGVTADGYWIGPEGVTIQLNNVKYKMSIDRPPVSTTELDSYLYELVRAMPKGDIIEQLRRSEPLWTSLLGDGYFERKGCGVLIEKLTRELSNKQYKPEEYQQFFANKNYLCVDRGVSEAQMRDLAQQGYILVPGFFEAIGMPRASSKLSSLEAASNQVPQSARSKLEKLAQDYGIEVAFEDFSKIQEPAVFLRLMSDRLSSQITAVELREEKDNTVRLRLKDNLPPELLSHALNNPRGQEQQLLYLLRGIAAYGLEHKIFNRIFTSQGDFVTTFGLDYDFTLKANVLLARNVSHKSDEGMFVEIELDEANVIAFRGAFNKFIMVQPQEPHLLSQNGGIIADGHRLVAETAEQKGGETSTNLNDAIPWTTEEEVLYQQAFHKDPRLLSDAERAIIQKREQLKQQFGAIPVAQLTTPEIERVGAVIEKKPTISEAEQARVAQMEAQLPGIVEAVNQLDRLVPEREVVESSTKSPVEKYLEWRASGNFYGELGDNAGYLTGKHLIELIEEQNRAEIPTINANGEIKPRDHILGALRDKLDALVKRLNVDGDDVEEFDIVFDPEERQLAQLGLLRLYTHLTTGVVLPNDIFIYSGTGSKGVNLGQKAIGMHESLMNVRFTEALRTFVHEVAHNYPEAADHGNMFRHAMESLFVTTIDRVSNIANKLQAGESLTNEERIILDMQTQWDSLLPKAD